MLATFWLVHMQVKCMIPEELGGDYEAKVSGAFCLPADEGLC